MRGKDIAKKSYSSEENRLNVLLYEHDYIRTFEEAVKKGKGDFFFQHKYNITNIYKYNKNYIL